ncbi:DMT family transporter [Nocardia sp. NPDC051570]|uniref:DMT family transporter n=1 Tax=Nocardia sp. NPDC051570 TaxID=3364324 RepID=UPI00379B98C6
MSTDTSPAVRSAAIDVTGAAAAAVAVALWASAFVAIRDVGAAISPAPLALLRLAVAAVALTVPILVRRSTIRLPRERSTWVLIGAYAMLWLAGYTVALNAAEQQVDAGTAALLVNLAPLLVAFGAGMFLGEALPRTLFAGMVVSLAGVGAIALGGAGRHDTGGVLLCLLAAVLYAAGVLVQKPALRRVDPLTAIWLGCLIGTAVLAPWTPQLITELAHAPARVLADGVYLGLFPTAIGFTAWSIALRRTAASRLTATTYAVPAVSALLSWLALGEVPTVAAAVGGAICLAGVAISRRRARA